LPLLADSLQQSLGRFVGRVLGHKATLEGPFQDALTKPGGSLQVGFYLGFDLVKDRESALNLFNYFHLLGRWRHGNQHAREPGSAKMVDSDSGGDPSEELVVIEMAKNSEQVAAVRESRSKTNHCVLETARFQFVVPDSRFTDLIWTPRRL
jgi:hypothetical protein